MIEWLWPWAFAALPLPWLVRRLTARHTRQQPALAVPSMEDFAAVTQAERSPAGQSAWRLLALCLAWALLVAALARPQFTGDPVNLPTTGRDLMLAVDISGSMATEDMEVEGDFVERLTVVKAVIANFAQARVGDRIGLVLFGTNAYLQAPLTFDVKSVNRLLIEAPVGIAGGKTAIGDAIGLAVKRLRMRPQDEKILILLTDGANNVGEVEPKVAAELAARDNIRIYTIGVGADEMRMPGLLGRISGRMTNPSADLDEDTLQAIADATGGRYFRARDPRTLMEIYALIDQLEPVEQEAEIFRPVQALYFWPLGASVLIWVLLLLADFRRSAGSRAHQHA
ncbi:MAG: VWA domain-containing protein [Gammaproteobacteria bacterium TMED243]|nr:BatB protein [Gammaproteobacteria bacterium]RPG32901.1 MAG: VWA domain-containing protein [Gammaproteobacteria bacterium TMED243]